jgi:quercetin dioxygenase-like cupin family protein
MKDQMIHKSSAEVERKTVSQGNKTYVQVLLGGNETPNFAMRKFTIEPGGSMPLHKNIVEHEQYVLNGEAELKIGEEKIYVKRDDVVFIPANTEHDYVNRGKEPFEFLCLVPNKEDKITLIK